MREATFVMLRVALICLGSLSAIVFLSVYGESL